MAGKQSADVDKALQLVAYKGMTPYAAAKKVGIALSTIYRAIGRLKASTNESLAKEKRRMKKLGRVHDRY